MSARALLRYALPHRGVLLSAFAFMAALGLTTGALAYLVGPGLSLLLGGGERPSPLLERVVPSASELAPGVRLTVFVALVIAIAVVKGLAYLGQFYFSGLFGQRVVADLRRALFAKLLSLSPLQLSTRRSGDLLSRVSSELTSIELALTYTVASYVRDSLQLLVLGAVALSLSPPLALAAIAVVLIAVMPASRLTRSLFSRTRTAQAELGALAAQVREGLSGLRTVQAFNAEARELERFRRRAAWHERQLARAAWVRGAVPGMMEVLAATAIALCLGYATARALLPVESLLSLLTALVLMYQPAKDLGRVTSLGVQALAAAERVVELLSLPEAVPEATSPARLGELAQAIELKGVRFGFGGAEVLEGVDLRVPVGKVTALVGPSGCGKSTLAGLLVRFHDPTAGQVLLDGQDARGLAIADVRRNVALVTQEPMLFSTSLAENLRVGRPDASAQEVAEAARLACAEDFVRALPEGLDTEVGERGVKLSGGQRQRVCIARAVLSRARVLVFDEATSNLDPESERAVQESMRSVLRERSALVIAHRLATVVDADEINVMDQGRIVERGRHDELLARGGLYARLWALQHEERNVSERAS